MLKCYYRKYLTTIKGVEYVRTSGLIIQDESESDSKEYTFGWDKLTDVYYNLGLILPFNVWNMKKGRVVSFFNAKLFDKRTWDIKEWKESLSVTLKITYEDYKYVSINDILKYHNHKLAIQYLKQEGMTING